MGNKLNFFIKIAHFWYIIYYKNVYPKINLLKKDFKIIFNVTLFILIYWVKYLRIIKNTI